MGHHRQGRGCLGGIVEHVQGDVVQVGGVEVQPTCEASQGRGQGRHRRRGRWGSRGHLGGVGEMLQGSSITRASDDLFCPVSLAAENSLPSQPKPGISLALPAVTQLALQYRLERGPMAEGSRLCAYGS